MTRAVVDLYEYRLKKGMQVSFGQRLAAARKNRGITQQQLIENFDVKIDRSVVSKWETGTLRIQPDDVVTIARALSMPGLLKHYCSECPVAQALEKMTPRPAA